MKTFLAAACAALFVANSVSAGPIPWGEAWKYEKDRDGFSFGRGFREKKEDHRRDRKDSDRCEEPIDKDFFCEKDKDCKKVRLCKETCDPPCKPPCPPPEVPVVTTAHAPEPGTLVLGGIGLAGLIGARFRRRKIERGRPARSSRVNAGGTPALQ